MSVRIRRFVDSDLIEIDIESTIHTMRLIFPTMSLIKRECVGNLKLDRIYLGKVGDGQTVWGGKPAFIDTPRIGYWEGCSFELIRSLDNIGWEVVQEVDEYIAVKQQD